MSIELNTEAAQRASELKARLQELTDRKEEYEALALDGQMTPAAVTELEGERRFAQMRAEAAERAARQERDALGSNEKLSKALNDFLADDQISVEALHEGLAAIAAAVDDFKSRVAARDEAVKAWTRTLRSLGVPDTGLTVDGLDIAVTRNGQVTIGDRTVNLTGGVDALILGALPARIGTTRLAADSLDAFDRRQSSNHLEIKVTKPIGGKSVGEVLSTRKGYAASQLARMVHSGHAKVTSGELPEPDLTEQQLIASRDAERERQAEIAATRIP